MSNSKCQNVSAKRQATTEPEWSVLARHHPRGVVLPQHQHRTGQLVFALGGVMLIQTDQGRWTIPPQRALWVPTQHPHSIQMLSDTELRTVYFQPSLIAGCTGFERQGEVHAVVASPLIRELVLGLFDVQRELEMRRLMACLLLHAMRGAEALPTHLPMPTSEALRRTTAMLMTTNAWHLSMEHLASLAAMSERSFTRRFSAEVGLSFRTWRRRARIIASLDLLASNRSIKQIAHAMQFAGSAAYVMAFRELMGATPAVFRNGAG